MGQGVLQLPAQMLGCQGRADPYATGSGLRGQIEAVRRRGEIVGVPDEPTHAFDAIGALDDAGGVAGDDGSEVVVSDQAAELAAAVGGGHRHDGVAVAEQPRRMPDLSDPVARAEGDHRCANAV